MGRPIAGGPSPPSVPAGLTGPEVATTLFSVGP